LKALRPNHRQLIGILKTKLPSRDQQQLNVLDDLIRKSFVDIIKTADAIFAYTSMVVSLLKLQNEVQMRTNRIPIPSSVRKDS
jgi:hypothetical protein